MAADRGSLCSDKNSARRRIPIFCLKSSPMARARLGDTPRISHSFSGSFSMTFRASSPNLCTICRASPMRMPFTTPEARYSSTAFSPTGIRRVMSSALNCSP